MGGGELRLARFPSTLRRLLATPLGGDHPRSPDMRHIPRHPPEQRATHKERARGMTISRHLAHASVAACVSQDELELAGARLASRALPRL
jgi:hypothetical protein